VFSLDDLELLGIDKMVSKLPTIQNAILNNSQQLENAVPTMNIEHTIQIDPDVLVTELCGSWIDGNKNEVIQQLATDHAGLTALFLCVGISDHGFNRGTLNEVTSRLNDIRTEIGRDGLQIAEFGS